MRWSHDLLSVSLLLVTQMPLWRDYSGSSFTYFPPFIVHDIIQSQRVCWPQAV